MKWREIAQTDIYKKQAKLAELWLGQQLLEKYRREKAARDEYDPTNGCESPAEAVFAMWWQTMAPFLPGSGDIRLVAQQPVVFPDGRRRRLDFSVTCADESLLRAAAAAGLEWNLIAVEIDGHAFHERTKEQVIDRDQRDRDLQACGVTVVHLSYNELIADPHRCVGEVFSVATDQYRAFKLAVMDANPSGGQAS